MSAVLNCQSIYKHYQQGPQTLHILQNLELAVEAGEHIAIVGASGSGKSTLLNVLGGLDKPDQGRVALMGEDFSVRSENQRGLMRNRYLGFVYQFHHLLGEFTALENVAMPVFIAGGSKRDGLARAKEILARVGLGHRLEHKPAQLSGGERQRVAIARALANNPACVLMDEPTGNLDGENARAVQQLMVELSQQIDTAFVVVTHDLDFAHAMSAVYELRDGALQKESKR